MSKQRYIVVDDDPTNNLVCEFTIKRSDKEADIIMFTQPEKALGFIKENYCTTNDIRPVILFLDINMPTMTGWEFLNVFIQFDDCVKKQFTIYILSSSIEDFKEQKKIYSFVQGFLSKPLRIDNMKQIREDFQK